MRKKSVKFATDRFDTEVRGIENFLHACSGLPKQHVTWAHDHSIVRLYRAFETMMLEVLVASINNDTATTGAQLGVPLPKHLTDEVCRYLVVGTGYFDYKGRDGLLEFLQRFVPSNHWLVTTIKKDGYKEPLERLSALRNFAAHGSMRAKLAAKKAVGQKHFASSGAWLKSKGRFRKLATRLRELARDIAASGPR